MTALAGDALSSQLHEKGPSEAAPAADRGADRVDAPR